MKPTPIEKKIIKKYINEIAACAGQPDCSELLHQYQQFLNTINCRMNIELCAFEFSEKNNEK